MPPALRSPGLAAPIPPSRRFHVAPTSPQRCRSAVLQRRPHAVSTPQQRRRNASATPHLRSPHCRPHAVPADPARSSHAALKPAERHLHAARKPLAHCRNAATTPRRHSHAALTPPSRRRPLLNAALTQLSSRLNACPPSRCSHTTRTHRHHTQSSRRCMQVSHRSCAALAPLHAAAHCPHAPFLMLLHAALAPLYAALASPSRIPHAAARRCSLSPRLPPHIHLIIRLHTAATLPLQQPSRS